MSSLLENAYLRHRLRQMDQLYPQRSTFSHCDCTSVSYFILSLVMISVGIVITIFALSQGDGTYVFSNLGHMWMVGPIFICSGLMVAVKSIIYLRRKNVIQMLIRQRALLRELAHQSRDTSGGGGGCMHRNPSTLTLPPTYETLMTASTSTPAPTEAPPPSYEEAMFLIGGEKVMIVVEKGRYVTSAVEEPVHSNV